MTGIEVGVVFRPQEPPERLLAVARRADAAGLDHLWVWEDCFLESGIASAAAALGATERLVVGIGVLPTPLRNVALTAMEVATLTRLYPGRLRVGLGHGVQSWMDQVGARVQSPLTLLREQLTALHALLGGETVTTAGRYVTLTDVTLGWPPSVVPPVLVGAGKPRTLALSGELGDGTVLTGGTTPDQVREARVHLGASEQHTVTVYIGCAFDSRPLGEDVDVAGTPADVADGLTRWIDAGADVLVLQPAADEPDLDAFVDSAGDVRRLLLTR